MISENCQFERSNTLLISKELNNVDQGNEDLMEYI